MDNQVSIDGIAQDQQQQAPAAQPLGIATTLPRTFFFKTDSVRDDEGKIIGKGRKHPDVKAVLPIPTFEDLKRWLEEGGKTAAFVVELCVDAIDFAARKQIADWREANGLEKDFTPTAFDLSKLSLDVIAATPRSERASAAISEDEWSGFLADYAHVMEHAVGYEVPRIKLHVAHFKTQFRRIKNDKAAVGKLQELLNLWATKTENLEEYVNCYNDLDQRATRYLKAEDKNVAEAF